eukprot:TRINITY_DN65978_c0_g1_i1.p1 TRINITY_DN65978_c0_g1~~TRINITY_DN65978_c0_g1_i1.p1  ORF type:complete len:242 (+),score=42.72 TRINITY_DN65978_c0_g1_i1:114-839(+)
MASCGGCFAGLFRPRAKGAATGATSAQAEASSVVASSERCTRSGVVRADTAPARIAIANVSAGSPMPWSTPPTAVMDQPLRVDLPLGFPQTHDDTIKALHHFGSEALLRGAKLSPAKALEPMSYESMPPLHVFVAAAKAAENLSSPPGLPVTSLGSTLHGTGQCSPCAWYWKPKSCLNGRECAFCHLCDDGELKARKKAKLALRRSQSGPTGTPPHTPVKEPSFISTPSSTAHVISLSSLL